MDTKYKEVIQNGKKTHGIAKTPIYNIYTLAKRRCRNKKCKEYKNYGGRGIQFLFTCFEDLYKELGDRPSKNHTLDRINTNGHYEKGNIKWSTRKEQNNNQRSNIKYNGESATDAAKRLGLGKSAITYRLKNGWSKEKAFTTPKFGKTNKHS